MSGAAVGREPERGTAGQRPERRTGAAVPEEEQETGAAAPGMEGNGDAATVLGMKEGIGAPGMLR